MRKKIASFVKWAGGKRQLLKQYEDIFPTEFNRYIEPFVGGGSVFFYLATVHEDIHATISDLNKELIITYNQIKNNLDELLGLLREHKEQHSIEHYYKVRGLASRKTKSLEIPEKELWDVSELSDVEIAARFIYLNRTCFNGLYRQNASGQFNVPMGRYKNPRIVREKELREVSKDLQHTEILFSDYKKAAQKAQEGDFVYFDPPYDRLPGANSFTAYLDDDFGKQEQEELRDVFVSLHKRGVKVMLSNSDTPFIRELYSKFTIITVSATRMINADSKNRGAINEVVVLNY